MALSSAHSARDVKPREAATVECHTAVFTHPRARTRTGKHCYSGRHVWGEQRVAQSVPSRCWLVKYTVVGGFRIQSRRHKRGKCSTNGIKLRDTLSQRRCSGDDLPKSCKYANCCVFLSKQDGNWLFARFVVCSKRNEEDEKQLAKMKWGEKSFAHLFFSWNRRLANVTSLFVVCISFFLLKG